MLLFVLRLRMLVLEATAKRSRNTEQVDALKANAEEWRLNRGARHPLEATDAICCLLAGSARIRTPATHHGKQAWT